MVITREQLRILLYRQLLQKNNVSLQCHANMSKLHACSKIYQMLSYRTETALQGAL